MTQPTTKPLDGEFWYVLDDENEIVWRPRPKLRGDFYLGWLGQNKQIIGAGLVRIKQGQLTHICTHGTPYFWLQPYEVLPFTAELLHAKNVLGADTMAVDFSFAGWGMRDQTPPETRRWPDAPISGADLESLLSQVVTVVVQNFRSEGEPDSRSEYNGLLDRAMAAHRRDPLEDLLDLLKAELGESDVVPLLIELLRHDLNVLPAHRHSDFFETMTVDEKMPSRRKAAGLVISAIYHLAPLLGSRRLNSMLLLNTLRQRHPFDVTWGADFLTRCFGLHGLARLLLVALVKERNDQIRGNVLDLLQELGYGVSVGLEDEVLGTLTGLMDPESPGAFDQVVNSHLTFIQEYLRQGDASAESTG